MKATVYTLEGKAGKEIELPAAFETRLNKELIKRAVLSIQSKQKQPKGANPRAGRDNTAVARSKRSLPRAERTINVGKARIPRLKNRAHLLYGRVAKVPQSVGGVRAHPPKKEKVIAEEINKKEKRKALESAIAASVRKDLVGARHVIGEGVKLPVVVESGFEKIAKTKEVVKVFAALKLKADIDNAKSKKRQRSGKGKQRGRTKKQKKSILVVTGSNSAAYKAARNIPGVDVCSAKSLNAELLAPGCVPGRLVLWTEEAIKALGEKK